MAKVYSPPAELPAPQLDFSDKFDFKAHEELETKWTADLKAYCIKHGKGKLAGTIVSHGVADGSADYMVFTESPLAVIHLPLGDAYRAGTIWERGLRITDVRQQVAQAKAWDELVKKSK